MFQLDKMGKFQLYNLLPYNSFCSLTYTIIELSSDSFQLHTFELRAPHRTVEEISDGVAMAEALGKMYKLTFSEALINLI